MNISVIIPTLQAESYLPALLASLAAQTMPPAEVIVVDSSSSDQTLAIAREHGCQTQVIPRPTFRHGRARNLGARLAAGEILVFLTQDALPADEHFLSELTRPLREGWAAAANARQAPYPDATPLERNSRQVNYPQESYLRTWGEVEKRGIKAVYFSNAASAFSSQVFWSLGGFSEDLIVNEDMNICTRLLQAGQAVAYQAGAVVYHSHNLSGSQVFRRYFDIGVSFRQDAVLLASIPLGRSGTGYLAAVSRRLVAGRQPGWLIPLYLEALVKWVGFQAGKRYRWVPPRWRGYFSGQSYYWQQVETA